MSRKVRRALVYILEVCDVVQDMYLSLFLSSFVLCFVCDLLCCCICVVILGKSHHYLLYYLVPAIQPRMLVTLDEDLKSVSVTVRVGQVGCISDF